jgi:hypothetical protein
MTATIPFPTAEHAIFMEALRRYRRMEFKHDALSEISHEEFLAEMKRFDAACEVYNAVPQPEGIPFERK